MKVPFIDLSAQYKILKNEIDEAIFSVIDRGQFIKGKFVNEFENSFAEKLGVKHCISVGNGTDALYIALKSLGIKSGDEVLLPAMSWISAAEAIALAGACPVFVDMESDYFTINFKEAKEKITKKTKALIAVHLYGQATQLSILKEFCAYNNLMLIEDCAQAHFSKHENLTAGTVGNVATFSFYPTKNLGAYGDAGCVVTDDEEVATYARRFSNHGGLNKHEHLFEGINSRMDELQAAVLLVKLKYINEWNEQRNHKATLYRKYLHAVSSVQLPKQIAGGYHTYHQFVIKSEKRDALKNFLLSKSIATEIHYPHALPFEPAYRHLNHTANDFPIAFQLQSQLLSLPIYAELPDESVEYVCSTIVDFYQVNI
jgi:dTDP-4-amino-4,6-dideoxygalactose transaminase